MATLRFEDTAANTVRLTVTSSLNAANEFFSDIAFNVLGFAPNAITANFVAGSKVGSFDGPTLNRTVQDAQNPAGPGTAFDLLLPFETAGNDGGAHRFNLTDSFQYDFSASGLDALDFLVANSQGYFAYSHVQGMTGGSAAYVNTDPGDPNTPVVPEPTSLLLLATGLIAGARKLAKRKV